MILYQLYINDVCQHVAPNYSKQTVYLRIFHFLCMQHPYAEGVIVCLINIRKLRTLAFRFEEKLGNNITITVCKIINKNNVPY